MAGLRRSTRTREADVLEVGHRTTVRGRKRKAQEAFEDTSDAGLTTNISENIEIEQTHTTMIKTESNGVDDMNFAPLSTINNLATSDVLIKVEPHDHNVSLLDVPTTVDTSTLLKAEHHFDLYSGTKEQPKPKPQCARKKRAMEECSDAEDSMYEKPKRKAAKKKKTAANEPHLLVITPGMLRPPGEKNPPMIYPVVKKPRDPKLPSLLSVMVSNFSEAVKRSRDKIPRLQPGEEEKRLLPYVNSPDDHYYAALARTQKQRLFVLQREHSVEDDCHANHHDCPIEDFLIAGSTGNVYTVTITHKPTCTCPDWIFRKRSCKHILYILHYALKVPDHLKQQNAFLTSELREIAKHAPPMREAAKTEDTTNKRKPVEDDCPICCMAFEEAEDIVWCQESCGNNVHKECFQKWAETRPHQVTCPFCRADWQKTATKPQTMTMADVTMPMYRNSNGYINVADQLGYV